MSITKRSFLIICLIISGILLTLNIVTYGLFRHSITKQILTSYDTLVDANNSLCRIFTQELNQLTYLYTADEELGELLSSPIGEDPLNDLQIKSGLNNRVAYILNSQSALSNKGFSTTLYLNPALPVSSLFQPDTTIQHVSRLFSAKPVMKDEWYTQALTQISRQYIFVDKSEGTLCFAKKLQNSHYSGTRPKDGVGVLLCSVPANHIPQIFSFHPLTENSGFALFNRDGDLLYQSDTLPDLSHVSAQFNEDTTHQRMFLDRSSYIYSSAELDWGLHLLFLTPYSDITGQLQTIMVPHLICSLIFLIIGALSSLLLSRSITRPVVKLTRKIESIEDIRTVDLETFTKIAEPPEIRRLNYSFANLIRRVIRLNQQIQKAAEQRRISELRALQAQMNPHFVLNAMNTVNYMALMRGQDDIAATVDSIASLMRYSITDPDKLVSIRTELDNIREYISVYTLRFRQQIRLEVSVDRPDTEIFIPKFTLQPLVENSIRHGITRQDAGITVFLRAWKEENRLFIEVTDTGHGADPDKLNAYLRYEDVDLKVSHGFGIRNVNERIRLHFGGDSGLSYSTDPHDRLAATLTICKDLPEDEKCTLYHKN